MNPNIPGEVPIGLAANGRKLTIRLEDGDYLVMGKPPGCRELLRTMVLGFTATASSADLQAVLIDLCAEPVFDGLADLPHVTDVIRASAEVDDLDAIGRAITPEILLRPLIVFVASDGYPSMLSMGAPELMDTLRKARCKTIVSCRTGYPTEVVPPHDRMFGVHTDRVPWQVIPEAGEAGEDGFALVTTSRPAASQWDRLLGRAAHRRTDAQVLIDSALERNPPARPFLLPPIADPPALEELIRQVPDRTWRTPIGWLVRSIEREREPATVDLREGLVILGGQEADDLLYTIVVALILTHTPDEVQIVWCTSGSPRFDHFATGPYMGRIQFNGPVDDQLALRIEDIYGPIGATLTLLIPDGWDPSPLMPQFQQAGFKVLMTARTPSPAYGSIQMVDADAGRTSDGKRFVAAIPALRRDESLNAALERIDRPRLQRRDFLKGSVPQFPGLTDLHLLTMTTRAEIFRAVQVHVSAEREVAIRVENVVLEHQRDRDRFLHEARTMGRVSAHPYVTDLFDAGITDDGRPFLVMELCAGSYASLMPLPPAQVVEIGVKIADALADAHDRGIVHGRIKPSKILVSRFNEPSLSAFGLPILVERAEARPVADFAYVPPENLDDIRPGAPGDIYGLCATLYAFLSGLPRWGSNPSVGIEVFKIYDQPIPEIPGVPEELVALLRAGMARNPEKRPTARRLMDLLARLEFGAETPGEAQANEAKLPRRQPGLFGRLFRGGD